MLSNNWFSLTISYRPEFQDQFDVIDLSDNNIRKLDNLPRLKRLETLFLHNNRIQQIDKHIGEQLPNLKTLALTNNNVSEFGDIDPLAGCLKLEYLTYGFDLR